MTSGRKSSANRRSSDESDDLRNAEAFEIAIEMSSGEPLEFSHKMLLEHAILSEYALICREPIDGLYITPSADDVTVWFGILFIRRGVYMGAVLRFTLYLPTDFPTSATLPTVVFDLDVYHPHIDVQSRELDLKRYFPDGWKRDKHHVYHVLLILQRTFFNFDADVSSCVNAEAAQLLRDDREGFMVKAQEIIRKSRSTVYDTVPVSDANAIRFFPWDASTHEPLRQRLIGGLTESQISSSSFFGSLGCSPSTAALDVRGKSGFSWLSLAEGLYMVEQPRPSELELPEGDCGGKGISNIIQCHPLTNGQCGRSCVNDKCCNLPHTSGPIEPASEENIVKEENNDPCLLNEKSLPDSTEETDCYREKLDFDGSGFSNKNDFRLEIRNSEVTREYFTRFCSTGN